MSLVGIVGSPRNGGNTEYIVSKILEGAAETGAETQLFKFSTQNVTPCQGCLGCHRLGQGCVLKDDMTSLYEDLRRADILVLGSPIYMGQMSAQAKIFTDRLFAEISPRFSPYYKERQSKQRLVLSFNQGNPNEAMFQEYVTYTSRMFELLEFDVQVVPTVAGLRTVDASAVEGLESQLKAYGARLMMPDGEGTEGSRSVAEANILR